MQTLVCQSPPTEAKAEAAGNPEGCKGIYNLLISLHQLLSGHISGWYQQPIANFSIIRYRVSYTATYILTK